MHRIIVDDRPATLLSLDKYQYQYDAGGNRTQLKKGLSTSGAQTYPTTFASDSNRATQYNSSAIVEDAAGNITSIGSTSYTYNNANRLSQVVNGSTTANYSYNGFGQRTTKLVTVGTTTTTTHYDYNVDGKYLDQIQLNPDASYAQSYEYIWLDDLPIAQLLTVYGTGNTVTSQRLTYIHADHLNTPKIMTDSTKKIVWRWDNEAYGRVMPNTDPDGDTVLNKLDLRYAGQIADSETNLFYNMNRYYHPMMGRYLQSDPIGLDGGLNTYAYVDGNPMMRTDPTGKLWEALIPGALIGGGLWIYSDCIEKCQKQMNRKDGGAEACPPGKTIGECAKRCNPFIDLMTAPTSTDDVAAEAAKAAGEAASKHLNK